jgi:hypothetical protein
MKGDGRKRTEEQFIYKTRKKVSVRSSRTLAAPPIPETDQSGTGKQFTFLFNKLNVVNTEEIVRQYVKVVDVPLKMPAALKG